MLAYPSPKNVATIDQSLARFKKLQFVAIFNKPLLIHSACVCHVISLKTFNDLSLNQEFNASVAVKIKELVEMEYKGRP